MKKKLPFYTKLAHILICLIALVYIAIEGQTILAPIVFAFLFSFLLLPLVGFLETRWKFPRLASSMIGILAMFLVISGIIYSLAHQVSYLAKDWPAFRYQIIIVFENLQNWIQNTFNIDTNDQVAYISESALKAIGAGTSFIGFTILSLSSGFIFIVLIFLYTFFILLHRRLLLRFIVAVFPEKHSTTVYEVAQTVEHIVKRYVFGIFLQMVIVTTLTSVGFAVIGIKYSLLLGLITGIINVIPYVGILVALLLSALITFATGTFANVLFVVVVLVIVHAIDGNFVMPKIVGSKVKINTLVALLGLVIGEMIWGITGMLLSIPVIAILKVIFDRVDDLKPWGMLLGDDDSEPDTKLALTEVKQDEREREKDDLHKKKI